MFNINLSALTKIVDISQYSLYPNIKRNNKLKNKNHKIELHSYLCDLKVNDFKFLFELNPDVYSFNKRLSILKDLNNTPETEYISAKEVRSILKIDNYELNKLRNQKVIDYVIINRTRLSYSLRSVIEYNKKPVEVINYSKQFYSPKEIITILNTYGISLSLKTIYRYIYDYNIIPCIKVYGSLRIPILEFTINSLPQIVNTHKK